MGNDILEFLATKEVMIVLAIVGIILLAYLILWFIGYLKKHDEKKKLQNNTLELNRLVEQVRLETKKNESANEIAQVSNEPKEPSQENIAQNVVEIEPVKEIPSLQKEEMPVVLEPKTDAVTIENGFTSPIEIKPVIATEAKEELVKNDSILLNNMYEADVVVTDQEKIEPVELKVEDTTIKYKDEVYTKTEAKKELERLTEELRKAENDETAAKENIQLTKFEEEQEENAIISLEELLEKGKSATLSEEIAKYEDEGDEPISIAELEARYKENKDKDVEVLEIEPKEEEKKAQPKVSIDDFLGVKAKPVTEFSKPSGTYKPSPIISPIYGIEKEPLAEKTNLSLEDTATYEKLDEEIRKTNEFLSKLRELQEKLD